MQIMETHQLENEMQKVVLVKSQIYPDWSYLLQQVRYERHTRFEIACNSLWGCRKIILFY